jgi:hypothetical protein
MIKLPVILHKNSTSFHSILQFKLSSFYRRNLASADTEHQKIIIFTCFLSAGKDALEVERLARVRQIDQPITFLLLHSLPGKSTNQNHENVKAVEQTTENNIHLPRSR